jgi:hypothetical protein
MAYVKVRRPYETETIAILRERAYDIADAEAGKKRSLEIN